MTLPKMRTAEQAYEEIKSMDPNTAIKLHHVRRMIRSGRVPVVQVSPQRKLVNLDLLIEALADPASLEVQEPTGIRRVEERRRA